MVETGEPLIRQALEAIRKAQEADASGLPEHEVARLQLLADSLYHAVIDVQLVKAGNPPSTIHKGVTTEEMTRKTPALYPDHPMYADAVEAMKRYHEAQVSGRSAEEIERLRQIAESQFRAVSEYQLRALGCHSQTPQ